MGTAKDQLKHFLALADQGPAQRAALAGELIDFLREWPEECPDYMREPILALLEMTLTEADTSLRRMLAARLDPLPDLPRSMLNGFFPYATAPVRRLILARNDAADEEGTPHQVESPLMLLVSAREEEKSEFVFRYAEALHIPRPLAEAAMADASGATLAVLSKGSGLSRAFFSTLALLFLDAPDATHDFLAAYGEVPPRAARVMTAGWQKPGQKAAA